MHTANVHKCSLICRAQEKAFTIVELLVVIVVFGILALIVMAAVNPGEVSKQTRDAVRVTDLQSIDRVLALNQVEGTTAFGSVDTVYISLPDSNANCSTYTLPTLPGGWSYACRPTASYRNTDGTGWIPVDLSNVNASSKLATLPIDPTNAVSGRNYYSYMTNNGWELNTVMESQNSVTGGNSDKVSTDGGDDPTKFEIGSNTLIAPWSFEFASFNTVANNSGFPGWFKTAGAGVITLGSDGTAANYIEATGYVWYGWQENIPFNPDSTYKMTCKARQVTDPTIGGKGIYCGWNGVAADGVALVNTTGLNTTSSQHYQIMANVQLAAGAGWSTYTGYTKGYGAPNGTSGGCNIGTPCKMHQDTRYIRPMFIMNYATGDGVADMDSILFTKQ